MTRLRFSLGWLAACLLATSATAADDVFPNGGSAFAPTAEDVAMPNGRDVFFRKTVAPVDATALAARIDRSLAAKWSAMGASPAPRADDAEFLRRASLDIAGRIPLASETRRFLDDNDPAKRAKLIDRLLDSQAYANRMTEVWRDLMIPEVAGNQQIQFFAGDFDAWLRGQFVKNAPYDAMVREVLTVSVESGRFNVLQQLGGRNRKPQPFAYLAAKDGKPENLAASASRLFMGVRIECAQCHNHPFAKWKREEFWGMAAFFSGVERIGDGDTFFQANESKKRHEITIPGTKKVIPATFLDGDQPEWKKVESSRVALADWMTSKDNPYFARAAVNRVWSQFFGSGIIDPVDDMGTDNLASHPDLLDALADQFAAHDFDLKYLLRSLTLSQAYQLSSAGGSPSSDAYRLFDRMAVRGMSPVQLYESVIRATGLPREQPQQYFFVNNNDNNAYRAEFLDRFATQDEKPTEHQTSILQALTLLNGRLLGDATTVTSGATLKAVADSYFLDTPGKIEALYLAALSRKPTAEEVARLVPYVENGGTTLNPKDALADVLWSLLGSAEFVLNH